MSGFLASLDELDSSLHGSSSCPEQTLLSGSIWSPGGHTLTPEAASPSSYVI